MRILGNLIVILCLIEIALGWWRLFRDELSVGTRSVLIGAHCFFIHPFFVAAAWTILYGFPFDPRLWVAFFVHDLGYWGKPNMDGEEGETHPLLGARIMGFLFDDYRCAACDVGLCHWGHVAQLETNWHDFCLYHSRHYSKAQGKPFSRLCVADKLVFALEPKWLYLPRVILTGEITEYLDNAKYGRGMVSGDSPSKWHDSLQVYMCRWVEEHKHGEQDNWTVVRHGGLNVETK